MNPSIHEHCNDRYAALESSMQDKIDDLGCKVQELEEEADAREKKLRELIASWNRRKDAWWPASSVALHIHNCILELEAVIGKEKE